MNYETFEKKFMEQLNEHAPMKERLVRANNAPFMNKALSKAVMHRSRLRNKYLRNPNDVNKNKYRKYRNYCVNLFKKEKKKYYENLDPTLITDNKKFWKTVTPLFSGKKQCANNIILIENDEIISKNKGVAETMNDFFSNAVNKLNIKGYSTESTSQINSLDPIINAIWKFKEHPSVTKIREKLNVIEKFSFSKTKEEEIKAEIKRLDKNKPTISQQNL